MRAAKQRIKALNKENRIPKFKLLNVKVSK